MDEMDQHERKTANMAVLPTTPRRMAILAVLHTPYHGHPGRSTQHNPVEWPSWPFSPPHPSLPCNDTPPQAQQLGQGSSTSPSQGQHTSCRIDGTYHLHSILQYSWKAPRSFSFVHVTSTDLFHWTWTTNLQPVFTRHGRKIDSGFFCRYSYRDQKTGILEKKANASRLSRSGAETNLGAKGSAFCGLTRARIGVSCSRA